jgi:hypothetical protein
MKLKASLKKLETRWVGIHFVHEGVEGSPNQTLCLLRHPTLSSSVSTSGTTQAKRMARMKGYRSGFTGFIRLIEDVHAA